MKILTTITTFLLITGIYLPGPTRHVILISVDGFQRP